MDKSQVLSYDTKSCDIIYNKIGAVLLYCKTHSYDVEVTRNVNTVLAFATEV
jgi:hypothetical protein